jgi:hypothetical protein
VNFRCGRPSIPTIPEIFIQKPVNAINRKDTHNSPIGTKNEPKIKAEEKK